MENLPINQNKKREVIFDGDDLILKVDGIHTSLTDKINEISKDLIPAVKNLYSDSLSIGELEKNHLIKDEVSKLTKDNFFTPAMPLETLIKTEFPEARWVVDKLFESGTINMISAPPNKWKSWIVILCALCVASGRELFGRFNTEKGKVLIVNEEDSERLLQERCKMLMEENNLPVYFHIGKQIKLEEEFVDGLIKECKEKEINLIIFDSLRSVHNADENSSKEMQEIMDQLKRITRENITIIFTHHNRKRLRGFGKNNDSSGEESRGSSAINAGIHGHLSLEEMIKEDSKYLIIYQQKIKACQKMEPIKVLIEYDKDSNKFCFNYDGEFRDEEGAIYKAIESINEFFKESNEGYAVKDLINMNIAKEGATRTALKMLESRGVIYWKERKNLNEKELLLTKNKEVSSNAKIYFRKSNELDDF